MLGCTTGIRHSLDVPVSDSTRGRYGPYDHSTSILGRRPFQTSKRKMQDSDPWVQTRLESASRRPATQVRVQSSLSQSASPVSIGAFERLYGVPVGTLEGLRQRVRDVDGH